MLDEIKSFIKLEADAVSENKNEVKHSLELELKNKNNLNHLINIEDCTFWRTVLKLLKIGGAMIISYFLAITRYFMLFLFCRNSGIAQLEALGSVIPAFSILTFGISWSCTQGYGFRSSQLAASKEWRNLGILTNQALVYNLTVGMIMFFLLFFGGGPFFSLVLTNKEAVEKVDIIFKYISISTPFQFWQMVSNRYYVAAFTPFPLLLGSILGFIVQIISLLIFVTWLELPDIGVGLSYSFGTISLVIFNVLNFIYCNPNPQAIVNFNWRETLDGLGELIIYSIPLGMIVFLSMISLDLFPFLGIIISDETFAAYGVIESVLVLTYVFGETMALSCNVQLNFAKATRNYSYIKTILWGNIFILLIYVGFTTILLLSVFDIFIKLYTTVQEVVDMIIGIKIIFILCQILLVFHSTFSESLSSLGHVYYPIITLFIGRYFLVVGLTFFLVNFTDFGYKSVIISLFFGLVFTSVANAIKIILVVKEVENTKEDLKLE